MSKKCILCDDAASFAVKDTNNYYCADCASEQFSDLSLLQKISEERKVSKELVDSPGREQEEWSDSQ